MIISKRIFGSRGVCGDLPLEGCIFSLAVILIPFPLCTGAKTEAEKAVKEIKAQHLTTTQKHEKILRVEGNKRESLWVEETTACLYTYTHLGPLCSFIYSSSTLTPVGVMLVMQEIFQTLTFSYISVYLTLSMLSSNKCLDKRVCSLCVKGQRVSQ